MTVMCLSERFDALLLLTTVKLCLLGLACCVGILLSTDKLLIVFG